MVEQREARDTRNLKKAELVGLRNEAVNNVPTGGNDRMPAGVPPTPGAYQQLQNRKAGGLQQQIQSPERNNTADSSV